MLRLSATHAAHVGAEIARTAYSICGTAGVFTDHPLAQALQDALVVPQHAFVATGTWQTAGQSFLGLDTGSVSCCLIDLALAEELDVPVALHTGMGPPGVSYDQCCRGLVLAAIDENYDDAVVEHCVPAMCVTFGIVLRRGMTP